MEESRSSGLREGSRLVWKKMCS
ncbi:mCG122523, isoform CRA_b [Mus musculus]|nr:mCG122523, isoform CRA_b [Mus musculus]